MIKSLIKSTNEVRVETETDADEFHKLIQKQVEDMKCTLSTFTKTLKQKKSKGEVLEEYYQIKYTFVFNDIKDPETYLNSIDYNMTEAFLGDEAPW